MWSISTPTSSIVKENNNYHFFAIFFLALSGSSAAKYSNPSHDTTVESFKVPRSKTAVQKYSLGVCKNKVLSEKCTQSQRRGTIIQYAMASVGMILLVY